MEAVVDNYTLLGVEPSVSQGELRDAYRRALRLWHPDGHFASSPEVREYAEEMTKRMNAAWHELRTPERRAVHDERHHIGPIRWDTEPVARTTGPGGTIRWATPNEPPLSPRFKEAAAATATATTEQPRTAPLRPRFANLRVTPMEPPLSPPPAGPVSATAAA